MPVQTRAGAHRHLAHVTASARLALARLPHIRPDELGSEIEVATGAFGAVTRSTWQGRTVAVKRLLDPRDPGERRDFKRECQLLASLPRHPALLQARAVCFEYPTHAVVTNLCEDGTTSTWRPTSLADVLACMTDLSEALTQLHALAILHRDVKPSNIIRDGPHFVLADLGLACRAVSTGDHRFGYGWIGTPGYMAPEIVALRPYGFSVDIYAAGVVFAFLLRAWILPTHEEPVVSTRRGEQNTMDGARPAVPWSSIPPTVGRLIDACWATHPSQRPCAAALADTLRTIRGWLDVPRSVRWTTTLVRALTKRGAKRSRGTLSASNGKRVRRVEVLNGLNYEL